MLCSNREEGFGPGSELASPLPTSCFTDIILIPLPVWLYLLLLCPLFVLSLQRRHRRFDPSTAHLRSARRRSVSRTIIPVVYYLLLVANILMQTLEIVRLSLIHYGIGLLPFTYAALIAGVISHGTVALRGRIEQPMWRAANTFVWIGLLVMNVVKTAGLVEMENRGIYRTGSKYPMSDQVIDVAVMAGVYLALAVLEVWLALWKRDEKTP